MYRWDHSGAGLGLNGKIERTVIPRQTAPGIPHHRTSSRSKSKVRLQKLKEKNSLAHSVLQVRLQRVVCHMTFSFAVPCFICLLHFGSVDCNTSVHSLCLSTGISKHAQEAWFGSRRFNPTPNPHTHSLSLVQLPNNTCCCGVHAQGPFPMCVTIFLPQQCCGKHRRARVCSLWRVASFHRGAWRMTHGTWHMPLCLFLHAKKHRTFSWLFGHLLTVRDIFQNLRQFLPELIGL